MPRRPAFSRISRLASFFATFAALLLGGCNNTSTDTPPAFAGKKPLLKSDSPSRASGSALTSFTSPRDDLGREIKLASPARRVVVIGPGALETVFALGAGERVVARDSAADFPASVKSIAIAGDYRGPFVEACVAARPDLIVVQGETYPRERIEGWQSKIGVPVAALAATSVDAVQKDADKIAGWLGVPRRDLGLAAPPGDVGGRGRTAFIEVQREPLWTCGAGALVSDAVERGGFENVARDVAGYKAFSKEALLQRQPDVYITTGKPGDRARIVSGLRADAALGSLKCVQRGQVLVLPGDFLLRPGPRLRDGIRALREARRR